MIKSFEHVVGEYITVCLGERTPGPTPVQIITIMAADYDDLMADKPDWSPNKPKDTFRLSDLESFVTTKELGKKNRDISEVPKK